MFRKKRVSVLSTLEMVVRDVLGGTHWMDIIRNLIQHMSFRDVFGTVCDNFVVGGMCVFFFTKNLFFRMSNVL